MRLVLAILAFVALAYAQSCNTVTLYQPSFFQAFDLTPPRPKSAARRD